MSDKARAHALGDELDSEQQAELGDLEEVARRLAAAQVPLPTAQEQAALVARLTPYLPRPEQRHQNWRAWYELARGQATLFEAEFWYACAGLGALILIGGLVVGSGALALFTLVFSPLVAAAGVVYAFRTESRALAALEMVSPISPLELFLTRLGLVLGANLVAVPLLLIPASLLFPELAFWRLVVLWLSALVGLCGLAVYLSLRWNGMAGVVIPLSIWGALVLAGWVQATEHAKGLDAALAWVLQMLAGSNAVLAAALLIGLAGSVLLYQSARWVQTSRRWA